MYDAERLRAGMCVYKLLLSTILHDNFRFRVWQFKQTVLKIVSHRKFIQKSRVYRDAYLKKFLYREIDMITQFYNSKNIKSAKLVYKKIVNLDQLIIQKMMQLFQATKQIERLLDFYTDAYEAIEEKKRHLKTLIVQIENTNQTNYLEVKEKVLRHKVMRDHWHQEQVYPELPDPKLNKFLIKKT